MVPKTNIRPSPLAGQWYPADPDILAGRVDRYLNQSEINEISGTLIALIAPHAGHRYSGQVAGHAYHTVRGKDVRRVIILSPMHHPHPQPILTTKHAFYQTPLGKVPVDGETLALLNNAFEKETGVAITPIANDREHAVEIQLPFLQRALTSDFAFLPLMIRDQDQDLMVALGKALGGLLTPQQDLLVASTDLSHFYPADRAEELDRHLITLILELNPEEIYQAEKRGKGFACGKGALTAVLWAAKEMGANDAQALKYSHSGEVTGDHSRVVGYAAAALIRR